MQLGLPVRLERMLGRFPRPTAVSAVELLLLSLLAVQCARLVWVLATPVDPVGDWRAPGALRPIAPASSVLDSFDPFFRIAAPAAPGVITALDLKLHGVREDRATGRGSAILGLPNGEQRSFAVGEEILPGVTLAEVGFDGVTILRSGNREQVFLDQSAPAQEVGGAQPPAAAPSPPPAPAAPSAQPASPPPAPSPASEIQFQPRIANGRTTGIIVRPRGSGEVFRAAGFAPGDVVVSVNGQPVTSAEQAQALAVGSGGETNVIVERAGRTVPLRLRF